jgi:hypothetical protein
MAVRSLMDPFHTRTKHCGYQSLPPSEQAAMDLFSGFIEISRSHERLLDLEVYVSRFPYSNTRITRMSHLRFLVEAYLHESYILFERLAAYPKLISRRLAKAHPNRDYAGSCNKAQQIARSALANIVEARGIHVHRKRFSTPDLENADLYDFLRTQNDSGHDRMLGDFTYREARKKWLQTMRSNNREILRLFELYFEQLYPLVFNTDGTAFSHLTPRTEGPPAHHS